MGTSPTKITSREYKLMLDHQRFTDRAAAVKQLWRDVADVVRSLHLKIKGEPGKKEKRAVTFLDTPDFTLRGQGLILRQRGGEGVVEYTVKCRSEDWCLAAGMDVGAVERKGWKVKGKLEEDIAVPFRCRFSHSTTVTISGGAVAKWGKVPGCLGEAAGMFPVLGTLRHDEIVCPPETVLRPVHDFAACERVFEGAKFVFPGKGKSAPQEATVAVIVWSDPKDDRPVVAEFSFRFKPIEKRERGQVTIPKTSPSRPG